MVPAHSKECSGSVDVSRQPQHESDARAVQHVQRGQKNKILLCQSLLRGDRELCLAGFHTHKMYREMISIREKDQDGEGI